MPNTENNHLGGGGYFSHRGFLLWLLVGCLFAGAFALRLCGIVNPPLDFHPIRQYRAALIIRAYYNGQPFSSSQMPLLEPPLTEYLAAGLCTAVGRESLTAIRVVSVVWWMLAAVLLYRLARRAISPDGAVVALAFFLFLPYGVFASRSIQPDALMVALFVGATWSIYCFRQSPSRGRLLSAAALSAAAIFIKPVCLFPIWMAYLSTGISMNGFRGTLRDARTWLFYGLSALPAAIYYGYGLFVADFLRWQAEASFQPRLIFQTVFWHGWLRLMIAVIGGWAIIAALLAVPLARSGLTKALLAGLWCGYFVYGLVFTYHIHTHDYYQLPLIPIVALSLGVVAETLTRQLAELRWSWRWGIFGLLLAALVLHACDTARTLHASKSGRARVAAWVELGERLEHSQKTVFLDGCHGYTLRYYGHIDGLLWPYTFMQTFPPEETDEHLRRMIEQHTLEFCIVTDWAEFSRQPQLQHALEKYPQVFSSNEYVVYDLRTLPRKNQ